MKLTFSKLLLATATFVATVSTATAQTARIVTGFPPGGSIDTLARIYVDEIGKELGKTFIVDTRPGAGGLLAVQNTLSSPADGNTILLTPDTNIVAYPHTVRKAPYNALKDLIPIGFAGTYEIAMATRMEGKIPDLKTFLTVAKSDRQMAAFGSPGSGTLPHFFGLQLSEAAGVPMIHAPYKGTGPAITDTIGGSLPVIFSPTATMLPQYRAKSLRLLATSGSVRGIKTPDVPTFHELGFSQMDFTGWFGFFVHAGTPATEIKRLNDAINRVITKPEVVSRLAAIDTEVRPITTAEFTRLIQIDNDRWTRVIKASGFTADN